MATTELALGGKIVAPVTHGVTGEIGGQQPAAQQQADYEAMSEKQLARELKRLEKEMLEYARNLEFEKAAAARDELFRIRQRVFGISGEQANIDAS